MGDRRTADIKTRISEEMHAKLVTEARNRDLAVADIVRAALREYLPRVEQQRAAAEQRPHLEVLP